jgi:hypothetical protein
MHGWGLLQLLVIINYLVLFIEYAYQTFVVCPMLYRLNIKKTTTYDVGNPGPGLVQAPKCGRVKLVNGILTSTPLYLT